MGIFGRASMTPKLADTYRDIGHFGRSKSPSSGSPNATPFDADTDRVGLIFRGHGKVGGLETIFDQNGPKTNKYI